MNYILVFVYGELVALTDFSQSRSIFNGRFIVSGANISGATSAKISSLGGVVYCSLGEVLVVFVVRIIIICAWSLEFWQIFYLFTHVALNYV